MGMLLTARFHFGQHIKCCSGACKYLCSMHAANAACGMTPKLLAANAAVCTTHALNLFFMKPQKLLQAYYVLQSLN